MDHLSGVVIGAAHTVLNTLGAGFLEKVYEGALALELAEQGLGVERQYSIPVRYRGSVIGAYFADLLVDERLLVELKVARTLDDAHRAQCLNYLKATGMRVCLLLNFGQPRLEVRRIVNDF